MQLKLNLNRNNILEQVVTGVIVTIVIGLITFVINMLFETKLDTAISKEFLNKYEEVYIEVLNRKCSTANYNNNYDYTDKEKDEILKPLKSISFANKEFYNDVKERIFSEEYNEYSENTYVYTKMNIEYDGHDDKEDIININDKGIIYRKHIHTGKDRNIPVTQKSFKVKKPLFGNNIKIEVDLLG